MSRLHAGLLLIAMSALLAGSLLALDQGDLAPRGTLLYARINDLGNALQKLQGDNWKESWERFLLGLEERDYSQAAPVLDELRRFVDHLGETELAIADIMMRDPNVQMVVAVKLKDGAPVEFSEALREWIKKEDRKAEVTPTAFRFGTFRFELRNKMLLLTVGGMLDAHLADVLEGFTDESLSKTERFTKWNERAKGDIVVYADMKAWRNAIDRLGEKPDADLLLMYDMIEWQKWDMINASVTLPGQSGGMRVDLDLTFAEPLTRANAFLKPAGASRLASKLPAETLGFVQGQLGNNHEQTYMDLLSMFHDIDQGSRKSRLENQLRWAQSDLKYMEEELARLEKEEKDSDKDDLPDPAPQRRVEAEPVPRRTDGSAEGEYDRKADLRESIANSKEEIARLQQQIANYRTRPFTTDRESLAEGARLSEPEQMYHELERFLGQLGLTRAEALSAIGGEVLAGVIGLPDPRPTDDDPGMFEDMWFVIAEATDEFPAVKQRMLDRLLARALPDDMPAEEREEAMEQAKQMLFKEVQGGEILRIKGSYSAPTMFAGDGFFGFAANDEIARMLLKAGVGAAPRFAVTNVPGGQVAGSKVAYANLGEMIARFLDGGYERNRGWFEFPRSYYNLRKEMPGGWHLAISTGESGHLVSISAMTSGEKNLSNLIKVPTEMIERERRYEHDRRELSNLGQAFGNWLRENTDKLRNMKPDERNKAIRAVNIESLIKSGHFTPTDGLRSAFDPAQEDAFRAMLKARGRLLGTSDKSADLSQAGFEWFGVPPESIKLSTQPEDREKEYEYESKMSGRPDMVIVAAMKGDWAVGGRLVLYMRGNYLDFGWAHGEDLPKLRAANAAGKSYSVDDDRPVPAWKARRQLGRMSWEVQSLQRTLQERKEAAAQEGKEFKIAFDGSRHDDPMGELRKLLGLSENDWLYLEGTKGLKIETTADGFKLRMELRDEWIELKPDGTMAASWDE